MSRESVQDDSSGKESVHSDGWSESGGGSQSGAYRHSGRRYRSGAEFRPETSARSGGQVGSGSWVARVRRAVNEQGFYALVYLILANLIIFVLNLPQVSRFLGTAGVPGLNDAISEVLLFLFLLATRFDEVTGRREDGVGYHSSKAPGVLFLVGAFILMIFFGSLETGLTGLVDRGSHALGLVYRSTTAQIEATQFGIWAPLDTAILVPIVEELLLRGVVMARLKPYGRTFAIVTSAFIFACMHGDLTQGVFTFLFGLLLGYVAMEYSLTWSIILHVANNLILADGVMWLTQALPTPTGGMVNRIIAVFGLVAGLVVLLIWRRPLVEYVRTHRAAKGTYKGWLALGLILLVLLALVSAAQRFSMA